LQWSEIWSFTLREEHRLQISVKYTDLTKVNGKLIIKVAAEKGVIIKIIINSDTVFTK